MLPLLLLLLGFTNFRSIKTSSYIFPKIILFYLEFHVLNSRNN